MTRPTPRAAAAAALLIALAACNKGEPPASNNQSISEIVSTEATPEDRARGESPVEDVISTQGGVDPAVGATPMRDRVAVIGLLNKRNGATRDVTLKPGQA